MDPNANLKHQLELAEKMVDDSMASTDARELAELVIALNAWIKRGGFLPTSWTEGGRL